VFSWETWQWEFFLKLCKYWLNEQGIKYRLSMSNLKLSSQKCSKSKTFWVSTHCHKGKIPHLILHDGLQSKHTLKILYKCAFRLCIQDVYKTQMKLMFRLGYYPQEISLYICKFFKIQKNLTSQSIFFS
jgi:hypothetical protein